MNKSEQRSEEIFYILYVRTDIVCVCISRLQSSSIVSNGIAIIVPHTSDILKFENYIDKILQIYFEN